MHLLCVALYAACAEPTTLGGTYCDDKKPCPGERHHGKTPQPKKKAAVGIAGVSYLPLGNSNFHQVEVRSRSMQG